MLRVSARTSSPTNADALQLFHPAVRAWFGATFGEPTRPQARGWPAIARGESTLIFAPTGSGKTLSAFLWCLDRLMFAPEPPKAKRCRAVYISPLKALAVDVERNLRVPLAGIGQAAKDRGDDYVSPVIAVRTGDTPQAERARFRREPADILITTPESLYLLVTSNARESLRAVETIIIDEIHALVPTKRGAHLMLSIERLAALCTSPPQRIGLSATQRPLDEVARFLGGTDTAGRPLQGRRSAGLTAPRSGAGFVESEIDHEFAAHRGPIQYRPVTIVDAGQKKALALSIQVPVENMKDLGSRGSMPEKSENLVNTENPSIWAAIHPRLLDLIRAHQSTLIFVNSRRVAERLAGAINELAGEDLVRSHHGSLAREQRTEVETLLKAGALRALVATSSLELGIDMGAIDLVVQIEAPPSVASGLQRIGRGGHQVNAVSEGIIFPKYRGDLLACAAVAKSMHDGAVEATRYPRNPLDIVAQQVVAMASMDEWEVDELYAVIRRAAPFAELSRSAFNGVLDMLSGRYPSDEFAELRPRITWNRSTGRIAGRESARHVAVINGGTIPDRGLYGVFLLGAPPGSARVGELDEEMVFETHVGETFVLGASSWRVEEITHDRVLVSHAPGEPGKMPFWKGDRTGRPLEFGLAIGRLTRDLLRLPPAAAVDRLTRDHDLDALAAENLVQYLRDQAAATKVVPDATSILVERVRDELGDWRVCVLSPRGGRIHAPWAMAAAAKIREERGIDVETLWGDDGFVVRFPDVDEPPDVRLLLPDPDEVQALVVRQLGATALFAAKFRENAARSLLLPKRRPGTRAPLWQQRKRASDLLAVASRFGSFPVLLETYRECLRDFFDIPALVSTLADVRSRKVRVTTVDSERPSPFAAALLFSYVASFLYDGDAPLAERRAQALAVDETQLRELVGDADLRELLDAESIESLEQELQRLDPRYRATSADGLHDMLLSLGDLSRDEIRSRTASQDAAAAIDQLVAAGRAIPVCIAGEERFVAVEDAARYRDALGVQLPPGLPEALLAPAGDPVGNLARRYARTHGPFTPADVADRYGLDLAVADATLARLTTDRALVEGEFRPGGIYREWTDAGVLRQLRRRSLARLRRETEPVDHAVLGRLTTTWQGVLRRRQGSDALLDAIEQLQGAPLAASILETEILPARIEGYDPSDLDSLAAAGEVIWVGVEPLGDRDGRIALYLADQLPKLVPPQVRLKADRDDPRESAILAHLRSHGASFFGPLHDAAGGGYPAETVTTLWNLAWRGEITNDTFHALRAFTDTRAPRRRARRQEATPFRSRRSAPPSAEGRWTLVPRGTTSPTAWAAAWAQQLLARHGVLTREAAASETATGGFGVVYPVLKAMEESGKIRRGYFVAGLGATQFALPGALDLLRSLRGPLPDDAAAEAVVLSATDPASPYGAAIKFSAFADASAPASVDKPAESAAKPGRGPTRTVGATAILVDGALAGYLARGDRMLLTFLPEAEPQRSRTAKALAHALRERSRMPVGEDLAPRGMLIEEIDGIPPSAHPIAPFLARVGFLSGAMGFQGH
jgi:ATP-dependent Lhr-like helicase